MAKRASVISLLLSIRAANAHKPRLFCYLVSVFTGIYRAQSRQDYDNTIYGMSSFFSIEFFIQLYEPQLLLQDNISL